MVIMGTFDPTSDPSSETASITLPPSLELMGTVFSGLERDSLPCKDDDADGQAEEVLQ